MTPRFRNLSPPTRTRLFTEILLTRMDAQASAFPALFGFPRPKRRQ
jgi:hypothetical protein